MKKEKTRKIVIFFVFLCVLCVAAYLECRNKKTEEDYKEKIASVTDGKLAEEGTEIEKNGTGNDVAGREVKEVDAQDNRDGQPGKEEKEEKTQENSKEEEKEEDFQITGISQEALEIMGMDRKELSETLSEWTYYNGYSMAEGAEFYPYMEIDFQNQICKMTLRLDDDVETVVNLQYYKEKKKLELNVVGAGNTEGSGAE